MNEFCLICGQRHKNAVRGGKVTLLRHCRKLGHRVRNMPKQPSPNYRPAPTAAQAMERAESRSRLQKALMGWGASGGNGFGRLEEV